MARTQCVAEIYNTDLVCITLLWAHLYFTAIILYFILHMNHLFTYQDGYQDGHQMQIYLHSLLKDYRQMCILCFFLIRISDIKIRDDKGVQEQCNALITLNNC